MTIEALHDHIWTVVLKVMEDAGTPTSEGLRIAMYLVDMLPTILIHLAFHSSTPGLTGFCARGLCYWSLVQDGHFGFLSHATTAKRS